MIVKCNNCQTSLKIDDAKIPATGTKIKCPKCQSIIDVKKDGGGTVSPQVKSTQPASTGTSESLIVACDHCKTKLKVPSTKLGTSVKCPKCQKVFTAKQEGTQAPTTQPPVTQQQPAPAESVIVACEHCNAKLKVPSSKLGLKLKCPKCSQVFTAKKEGEKPQVAETKPVPETKPVAETKPKEEPTVKTVAPPVTTQPVVKETPPVKKEAEVEVQKQTQVDTSKQSQPPQTGSVSALPRKYGALDPRLEGIPPEQRKAHEDAIRFAKALVSDIWMYNKDKIEQGLKDGTLQQLLGAEIKKSHKTYKMKVPPEIANTTNYFRDALNDIIGKGQKIF